MKNITIQVDDETYELSHIKAAEYGTTVTALVRDYLRSLTRDQALETNAENHDSNRTQGEREAQSRGTPLEELLADWGARGIGLRMADNLPREALYDRDAFR